MQDLTENVWESQMPFAALFLLVTFLIFTGTVKAQVTTGVPPLVPETGGPETIDLANLNTHYGIPLITRKGRGGMDFYYVLTYDSSIWYPSGTGGTGTWTPVFNWGWSAQTAVQVGWLGYHRQQYNCDTPPPIQNYWIYSNFVYHDANGTSHPFRGVMEYDPTICDNGTTSSLNAYANDNSGFLLNASLSGANLASHKVTQTDGSWTTPPTSFTNGYSGVTTTLTDRNGNEITDSSTTTSATYTDTLGTTALNISGSGTPSSPVIYTYTGPSGSVQYTMKYAAQTVHTAFGCGVAEYPATAQNLVSEIDLPDGTKYSFSYEVTPGDSHSPHYVTGRLQSVTLPTGGIITYTYNAGSSGHINCSDGSASGFTRATPDGIWTYAHTVGAPSTTKVTDPPGNQTAYNFSGLYETQASFYQGTTAGTLLKQNVICYNNNLSNCGTAIITPPITKRDLYTYYPTLSSPGITENVYNALGLVTDDYEFDYVPVTNGQPYLKHTAIAYETLGNNISAFPHTITIYDPSNTAVSTTTYNYDAGSIDTSLSGTPQHAAVSGSRGNVTSINYPAGSLTASITYYDGGQIKAFTDVNSAVTTYGYATGSSCGYAFPTSVAEPLGLSKSMTWNCTGGVQLAAVDENSQTVQATYADPYFWRPSTLKDQLLNVTTLAYQAASPPGFSSTMNFNGTTSVSTDIRWQDGLGRTYTRQKQTQQVGGSVDTVSYVYDSNGRLYSASGPCTVGFAQTCTSGPTTTQTYDAINRPLLTTDAGGGTITNTYSANDVLVQVGPAPTGEQLKQRQLEYDSLGRLTSVCELSTAPGSGTCSQTNAKNGYWTKYVYDVLGNLKAVTQNAQAAASSQQSRSYSYDAMSRLTSETNPESGTTAYSYDVSSPCISSNGDMIKKVDAIGTRTCIAFDALHRPTSMSNSINSTCKFFLYDSNPGVGWTEGNIKGRLSNAYIGNCTGGAVTGPDQGFNYSARGELLNIYQTTVASGIWYNSAASYWANGALNTLQLFYCSANCTNSSNNVALIPLITYGADGEGRPNTVSASSGQNPVTATVYNSASQPTSITYGSADVDTLTYTNTFRLKNYQFKINTQSYNGALTWNANGSLGSQVITDPFNSADAQTCSYAHDELARIATVDCGASRWQQIFAYDPFGNITKTVPTGGTGNSFQPTYSPSTNRFTSIPGCGGLSYDGDGRVLNDCSHTYTWDAYSNSNSVDSVILAFDATDRMVEQNRSGTLTEIVYTPIGQKFALLTGSTLKKAFVPLPMHDVAVYTASGLDHYRHADWLGSNRLSSTPTRTVQSTVAYAPFGETYGTSGTPDLAFTGQNADTVNGDYDFLFREYSDQGRWASPDPAGLFAVDTMTPQSWNRYAYVSNNAVGAVDSLGLRCTVYVFGVNDNAGVFDSSQTPAESSAYPYAGMGLLGGLGSAGFGSGGDTRGLTDLLTQYQGEEGGIDLVGWSGGAQTISTVIQDNPSLANNVASTTYLSPGINLFGGQLYQSSDSVAFKGSGIFDFAATLGARISGVQLTPSGAKGHHFLDELNRPPVQGRIQNFPRSRGSCTGGPQGSAGGASGGDGGFYDGYQFFSGDPDGEGGWGPGGWGSITVWRGPVFHVL